MTKSTPMLMKAEMVRAILMNVKRVTRRTKGLEKINYDPSKFTYPASQVSPGEWLLQVKGYENHYAFAKCPYGTSGDELWIKETFCLSPAGRPVYRADYPGDTNTSEVMDFDTGESERCVWKSSLFMPKIHSRLILPIVSIHPERLHEIPRSDCVLEGIETLPKFDRKALYLDEHYIGMFAELWNSINGKDPLLCWKANPWVWRIEFKA